MEQSLYEYVLSGLESTKGHWSDVAEESGVSKRTIEKIYRREIQDPGVSHIEKLASCFRRRGQARAI